jgi:hypothetical protein
LVLAALAGGSKLPFLPIAMLTFIDRVNVRSRFIYGITALCGGAALSLVFGIGVSPRAGLGGANVLDIAPAGRRVLTARCDGRYVTYHRNRVIWETDCVAGFWLSHRSAALYFHGTSRGHPYAALDPNAAWPFLASIPIVVFCVSTTYSDTVVVYPLLILLPAAGVLFCYSSIAAW